MDTLPVGSVQVCLFLFSMSSVPLIDINIYSSFFSDDLDYCHMCRRRVQQKITLY